MFYTFLRCIKTLLRAPPAGAGRQAQGWQCSTCHRRTMPASHQLQSTCCHGIALFLIFRHGNFISAFSQSGKASDILFPSSWMQLVVQSLQECFFHKVHQASFLVAHFIPIGLSKYKLASNTINVFLLHRFLYPKTSWVSQAPAVVQSVLVATRSVHEQNVIWQARANRCPLV